MMRTTFYYGLTEEGQKRALLRGESGRCVRKLDGDVGEAHFQFLTVRSDGTHCLAVRHELPCEPKVFSHQGALVGFDEPQSSDSLLAYLDRRLEWMRAESAMLAEEARVVAAAEAATLLRAEQHFLADPDARLAGGVYFFESRPISFARDSPASAEAIRREIADATTRKERRETAVRERRVFLDDWVSRYGTPGHGERRLAGLLSDEAVTEMIEGYIFSWTDALRRPPANLRAAIRHAGPCPDGDVDVDESPMTDASHGEWTLTRLLGDALPPDMGWRIVSLVHLRRQAVCRECGGWEEEPVLCITVEWGPIVVSREFSLREGQSS